MTGRGRGETYKRFVRGIVKVFRRGKFVGYRAVVWVIDPTRPKGGKLKPKRFKKTATLREMKEWRERARVAAKITPVQLPPEPVVGFAADALTYLETVKAMPSIRDRRLHIHDWIALFGDRPHTEITSAMIRAQRDRWLTEGPKRERQLTKDGWQWVLVKKPLAAQSVNLRLRALENVWTVMWPHESNPVREVDEVVTPDPEPKGQTFALAREILSFMPDVTTPKKGESPERGSLSRVRFEAMVLTGLSVKQLGQLREEHVDWTVPAFVPPRRFKGRSKRRQRARRRTMQPRLLMPEAASALQRLFALGGNRPFSASSLRWSIRRAIKAANRERAKRELPLISEQLRPLDLTRHTFGTEAYRASKNLKAVQDLMGHSDIQQSARYAMAAIQEHLITAVSELSKRARPTEPGERVGKVRGKKTRPIVTGRDRTRSQPRAQKPQ